MCCSQRWRVAIVRPPWIPCGTRSNALVCSTLNCGATRWTEARYTRFATVPALTYSCGRSRTSPFNISSTPQGRPNEQSPRVRPAVHRGLLHHSVRHRMVGRAAREERELRLFPGEPGRRVVRGRREPRDVPARQEIVGAHVLLAQRGPPCDAEQNDEVDRDEQQVGRVEIAHWVGLGELRRY